MKSASDIYFDGIEAAYSKRNQLRGKGWKDEDVLASMTADERFYLIEGDDLLKMPPSMRQ